MNNRWFNGGGLIKTYCFEELMATKLRALYQRKKGRDLFDLSLALKQPCFDEAKTLYAFQRYLDFEGKRISRAMFESNLQEKLNSLIFQNDISPLLPVDYNWNFSQAIHEVHKHLISKLPGEPLKMKFREKNDTQ